MKVEPIYELNMCNSTSHAIPDYKEDRDLLGCLRFLLQHYYCAFRTSPVLQT